MDETIERILQKYPAGKKESLIPLLQDIQKEEGRLSDATLNKVSRHMNIPLNKIYGVATFYDQFRFEKKGQYHIQICKGTACHLFNASTFQFEIEKLLQVKVGQTTKDGKFSLEIVNCLGACSNSPVISLNGVPHGNLSIERLQKIFSKIKDNKA
jgi:NADH-quinone oxidoreductase E subunit